MKPNAPAWLWRPQALRWGRISRRRCWAPAKRLRRTGLSIQDREALARVLALLGGSSIPDQLAQLNYYAGIGSLPLTPEVQAQLSGALNDVHEIRTLLLQALGMQPESE